MGKALRNFLRRYTSIPSLLYMLHKGEITFLDPATWDDSNDSHYLSLYREKKSLKCVLALCFTQASETYHHWRVFADGSAGVCITFEKEKILALLKKEDGVTARKVTYLTLNEMNSEKIKARDLPFLKRYPYKNEREFRVIYESQKENKENVLNVRISLECIQRITLSPWIAKDLANILKKTIKEIPGCKDMKIVRSTLISNERWKAFGDNAR